MESTSGEVKVRKRGELNENRSEELLLLHRTTNVSFEVNFYKSRACKLFLLHFVISC